MTRSIKVQIQVRLRETAKSGEIETADLALEFKVLRFLQIQLATHPHFTLIGLQRYFFKCHQVFNLRDARIQPDPRFFQLYEKQLFFILIDKSDFPGNMCRPDVE